MTSTNNISLSKVSKDNNHYSISSIQRRINDFFADISYFQSLNLTRWLPSINVSESENSILIKIELPFINEKDITINIQKIVF